MSKVLVSEDALRDMAAAIRQRRGGSERYTPGEMAAAVRSIPKPAIEPLEVAANGSYAVPEGADGYGPVTVAVAPALQQKTAEANGVVLPDAGYDGLSSVLVQVAGDAGADVSLPSAYRRVAYLGCDGGQYVTAPSGIPAKGIFAVRSALDAGAGTGEAGVAGYTDQVEFMYENDALSVWTGSGYGSYEDLLGARAVERDTPYWAAMQGTAAVSALYIGRYRPNRYPFSGRIYEAAVKVLDPERLELVYSWRLIPCCRVADDAPGFFDVVGGGFYPNEGDGAFAPGPEVA